MKTFGDLYDQWINEIYESQLEELPSWITGSLSPAALMQENDPTMYRCGFSDWLQDENVKGIECENCDREIDTHYIVNECDSETAVQCQVCNGTHFECQTCFEVKENGEKAPPPDEEICKDCHDEAVAESEAEDEKEQQKGE